MRKRIFIVAIVAASTAALPTFTAAQETEPYSGGEVTQTTLNVTQTTLDPGSTATVLGTTLTNEQLPKTGSSLTGPAIAGLLLVLAGATVVWIVRAGRSPTDT